MTQPVSVLILDDGELDDVQRILEELAIPYGRVRGGAIAPDTPPPQHLLIATPRRIDAVKPPGGRFDPAVLRIVVVNEDSVTLRAKLRRTGFDYLVRRPVHFEALRLLILRCLYSGEERRREPRLPLGYEISFRTGLLPRRATLADLSSGGCRLLSQYALEEGGRVKVEVPEALGNGEALSLPGHIIRSELEERGDDEGYYSVAVAFDPLDLEARSALEAILRTRAKGPISLDPGEEVPPAVQMDPEGPPLSEPYDVRRVDMVVDVRMEGEAPEKPEPESIAAEPVRESETEPETAQEADTEPELEEDQRNAPRRAFEAKVAAYANRALRVLVGRDLSLGGMRVARIPDAELGDRLHLAVYGPAHREPFLVWATVARDDGPDGIALVFDPLKPEVGEQLEMLVASLPAVESLRDTEAAAMGTVVSEILET